MTRAALWIAVAGALAGAAGVIAAASAAHATADPLMSTAANFLSLHAAALLAIAALVRTLPGRAIGVIGAATLMVVALALFCGDLATRAVTGTRLFPFAAPIGGTGLIVAWLVLAIALLLTAFKKPGPFTR